MDDFRLQYLLESCRTRLRGIQLLKAQVRETAEPNGFLRVCLNPSLAQTDRLKRLDQMIRSFAYLVNQVVLTSIDIERQLRDRETGTKPPAFLTRPLRHTRDTVVTSTVLPFQAHLHKLQTIAQLLMAERHDVPESATPRTSEKATTFDQPPIFTIDDNRPDQQEPKSRTDILDTNNGHSVPLAITRHTSSNDDLTANRRVTKTPTTTKLERIQQPMVTHPPPAKPSSGVEVWIDSESEGSDIEVTLVDISTLKSMPLDPIPSQNRQHSAGATTKNPSRANIAPPETKLPVRFDMVTYTLAHLRKHLHVSTMTIPNEVATNWTDTWLERNLRNLSLKSHLALCDFKEAAATLVPSSANTGPNALPDTYTNMTAGLHRRERDPHCKSQFIRDAHQCTPWRLKRHLAEPSGDIQALALVNRPDNMYCAIGAWADKLEAYNKPGNMCMYDYRADTCQVWKTHQAAHGSHRSPHYMTVNGVRYSPSTDTLVTCGLDRTVQVWSTKSFEQLSTTALSHYPQRLIGLDSARTSLTAIYDDMGVIHLLSIKRRGLLRKQATQLSLGAAIQGLSDMLFTDSAASPRLVTSYEKLKFGSKHARVQGRIQFWDVTEARAIGGIKVSEGPVFCLDYFQASQLLASGNATKHDLSTCHTNILRLTDPRRMQTVNKFSVEASIVNTVKFSHCGRFLAAGTAEDQCYIYDIRFGKRCLSLLRHQGNLLVDENEGLQSAHWLPNASLVTGGADCKIKCWDIRRSDPLLWEIDDPDSPITCSELQATSFDDVFIVGTTSGSV
ncbi:hypothetical protein H4R34_001753, partial [Dimargaris verticillata]